MIGMISTNRLRLITTFGLGHLRPFPGTWGSMPTALIAGLLIAAGFGPVEAPWIYHGVLGVILVLFSAACIVQGDAAEVRFGKKDPGSVVADETAGQAIPLMFLPAASLATGPLAAFTVFYAFVAFRIFDIVKLWPARAVQRVPAGWGILLDDLIAGVMAMITVQAVARIMLV